jgi:flagellar biosynthetic protein FlhB
MADSEQDQKTEGPSEKRLHDAHERGQFARSAELGVVFALAGALGALALSAPAGAAALTEYTLRVLSQLHNVRFDPGVLPPPVVMAGQVFAVAVVPMLAASVLAALLSGGIQSGFQLTTDALGFRPERFDVMAGFGRLFSKNTLVHAAVDALKLLVIGGCLWGVAQNLFNDPLFTTPVEASYLGRFIQQSAQLLLGRLILALGVIAAISYAYERFKTHQDLMMTREEVKEERKHVEGNIKVKLAMRRMARRLAQRQMLKAVATADVVVTNPTHYAVALKYERRVDQAPVVLAKGDGGLARRIKAIAAEHEVPMVENKPIARTLFAMGRVGEPIPTELYHAVAGILAMVYRTHRYYFFRLPTRRSEEAAAGS